MNRLLILSCLLFWMTVRGAGLGDPILFSGMCDASATVALDQDLFAVASDEDNILRFYRLSRPGAPVFTRDLTPLFAAGKKKSEADIEGAARLGGKVFMITSHGRNADGKPAPLRQRLIAFELKGQGGKVEVVPFGKPCTNLLAELFRDSRFTRFNLAEASRRAPKSAGGLNIEALTDTPEGALLIGFRSPVPGGRAMLIPLVNPMELMTGTAPKFGDPILLDLGGLGLRGAGSMGRSYYLIAGPVDNEAESRLFFWTGGAAAPTPVPGVQFPGINPEGVCFHDETGRRDFLILSDDGTRKLDGKDCKSLPESQRQFRAYRLDLRGIAGGVNPDAR